MKGAGWSLIGLPLSVPTRFPTSVPCAPFLTPTIFFFTAKSGFTPLLEAKTERFAANSSRITSQDPFAWASNSPLRSFQNT